MKSNKTPSITVFYPFLNDWGTVGSLVALAADTLEKITDDWEILIIDDGSEKDAQEALKAVVRLIKNTRIIHHPKNLGYGAVLRTGFKNAKKELIFYTDGDAQYDPRELVELLKKMELDNSRLGMVNGYKIKRSDPTHRVIAGQLYHYIVKFFFQLPIRDTDCDFRLLKKEVLNAITLKESSGTICVELVKTIDHAGYTIAEVPVHHYWRTSGKSQFFNFNRLFHTFIALIKLWIRLIIQKRYV